MKLKASKIERLYFNDLVEIFNTMSKTEENIFIIDKNVSEIYCNELSEILKLDRVWISKEGESCKSLTEVEICINYFLKIGVSRSSHVVVIGGGATSDFGGFVASLLLRGLKWTVVPTTLLGMIDASIGGKVAINSVHGKNLIGSFYLPSRILLSDFFLKTLSSVDVDSGKGELLKYGLLNSDINRHINNNESLPDLIHVCSSYKNVVIERDLYENLDRVYLNLGHTIGHAVEKAFNIPHGISVIFGIKKLLELFPYDSWKVDFKNLLDKLSVDLSPYSYLSAEIDSLDVFRYIKNDKKSTLDDSINLVLLKGIGRPYIKKININDLLALIERH